MCLFITRKMALFFKVANIGFDKLGRPLLLGHSKVNLRLFQVFFEKKINCFGKYAKYAEKDAN